MENRRQETNIETRFSVLPETQAALINEETRTIRGYGIVFNKESVDLYHNGRVFREVIRPEAIKSLGDVSMYSLLSMHNHKSERLLGNTKAGTMRVGVDNVGVWYETDLPDSPTGQDVLVSVKRRDTDGSSFQFSITEKGDRWSMRNGKAFREVVEFEGIYEMGPVSEPAYPDATISKKSARSLESLESDEEIPVDIVIAGDAPEPTQTDFQALADAELAEFQQMQLLTL
jgi:HK97 family phage prohead protease